MSSPFFSASTGKYNSNRLISNSTVLITIRNTYQGRSPIIYCKKARSMDDSAEVVIGEVPVIMRLNVGSERLSLLFTNSRMIVARVGKRGAGSTASLPLWAMLSGGIEGLFKWRKEKAKEKAATVLTPERILASDRDNFPVPYDHIVSVELTITETGRTGIMILTRDDKFTFSTGFSFEKVSELFRDKIGTRLSIKRNQV